MKDRRHRDIKEEIARAYRVRAIRDGHDKVRALDLAKDVGVNKNTFYYHFATRQSVAYWILRRDIALVIEGSFDPGQYVYAEAGMFPNAKDAFEELPYYVRVPQGARMLDQGRFIKELVLKLREDQDYYRTCFREGGLESISAYMQLLFKPAMEQDVDIIADGRYLPSYTRSFLATSMMNMNFGIIRELVCEPVLRDETFDDGRNPFWNVAAESLNEALRNHPIFNPNFLPERYRMA